MDRTILLWMEESNDGDAAVAATGVAASGGVWVPISRVGWYIGWIDWCLAHGICRC